MMLEMLQTAETCLPAGAGTPGSQRTQGKVRLSHRNALPPASSAIAVRLPLTFFLVPHSFSNISLTGTILIASGFTFTG